MYLSKVENTGSLIVISDSLPELNKNIASEIKKISACCIFCSRAWKEFSNDCKTLMNDLYQYPSSLPEYIKILKRIKKFETTQACSDCNRSNVQGRKIFPRGIDNNQHTNSLSSTIEENIKTADETEKIIHSYSLCMATSMSHKILDLSICLQTYLHRQYDAKNDGKFPLRSVTGQPCKVTRIAQYGTLFNTNEIKYENSIVKKMISSKTSDKERRKLFNENIRAMKIPHSNELLGGQYGLFSNKIIPEGTCLGVFGGRVFKLCEKSDMSLLNTDYIIHIGTKLNSAIFLDADNILSKVNSNFLKMPNGRWEIVPHGYNSVFVFFKAEFEDKTKLVIPALFSSKKIDKNEEVRVCYHLDEEKVNHSINKSLRLKETTPAALNLNFKAIIQALSHIAEDGIQTPPH